MDSPTLTTTSCFIINDCDAITSGSAMQVQCASGSLATTANAGLVMVNYTGNSTAASNLVYIKNDHADADATVGLKIKQDGAAASIELEGNGGIKFPGTQGASSDANTLDDYEEGTWTPALASASATFTTESANGFYTKVGDLVHISLWIKTTAVSGTTSNSLEINGLPFTTKNTTNYFDAMTPSYVYGFDSNAGAGDFVGWRIEANVTRIDPIVSNDDGVAAVLTAAAADSSDCRLVMGGTYKVA